MLVVIGAGPYGLATAAAALRAGVDTAVVGKPLSFWVDNMPAGMYLRSGPDWHLDANGVHTFEAFLEERGIAASDVDPVPIAVFLAYARWFQLQEGLEVRDTLVTELSHDGERFRVGLEDGDGLDADAVVAAPGIRHFQNVPEWSTALPEEVCAHTCDLVRFEGFDGARVLIVGGRQSAYEWAALAGEHGAERVDIVHRHDVPRFERVSWKFADPWIDQTLAVPGWYRRLPAREREAIGLRFWEVGRLTLEWWLTPRLAGGRFRRWPGTAVVEADLRRSASTSVTVQLTDGSTLEVDRVVLATGYRTDLRRVPYLAPAMDRIELDDGFPVLDESFQSTLPGLYIPGFASTKDFGPFFGFTKGCPAAAAIIARHLARVG